MPRRAVVRSLHLGRVKEHTAGHARVGIRHLRCSISICDLTGVV
jgi:hypothetical protein